MSLFSNTAALYVNAKIVTSSYLSNTKIWDIFDSLIVKLFGNTEEGGIWSPSSEVCFTDTVATTNATVGNTVAYITDESGNNGHSIQSTAASRSLLGRTVKGNRKNLVINSDRAYGSNLGGNASFQSNVAMAPNGTMTASRIYSTSGGTPVATRVSANPTSYVSIGEPTTAKVYLKAGTLDDISFDVNDCPIRVNLTTGEVIHVSTKNSRLVISHSMVSVGDGWYKVSVTGVRNDVETWRIFADISANNASSAGDDYYVWGMDVRHGDDDGYLYQRIGTSTLDISEQEKQDLWYLKFDGIDDFSVHPVPTSGLVDIFMAVRLNETQDLNSFVLFEGNSDSNYICAAELDSTSTALNSNAGTPTLRINGVPFTGTTRNDLYTALVGNNVVIEVIGADLSLWNGSLRLSGYSVQQWKFGGLVSSLIIRSTMSETERTRAREYCAIKAGIVL